MPMPCSDPNTEVVVAPPALYLLLTREHLDPKFEVAAQNIFDKPSGAFTGEISASQLKDSGISWTLLGHSERRTVLREDDDFIASKTKSAIEQGIGVILCCGESLEEREKGTTVDVVTRQLDAVNKMVDKEAWKNIVIAYEPIWAIGTGKVATTGKRGLPHVVLFSLVLIRLSEQAQEVHAAIRDWLSKSVSSEAAENTRIIYGGSVSDKNCRELAKEKDIDGFLVGGASLKPAFVDIINANQ